MKHSQIRRARKLGEAVFRGAGAVYTFEVFPLTTDIRDSAAVYIISRRITDRSKTGHHRAICVGEADSIVGEIKKHKRAKCAKSFDANALCILRENDHAARSKVIDDLVAARSFDCVRNVSRSPISSTSRSSSRTTRSKNVKEKLPAKAEKIGKKQTSDPKAESGGPASAGGTRKAAKRARAGKAAVTRAVSKSEKVPVRKQAASKKQVPKDSQTESKKRQAPKSEVVRRAKKRPISKPRTRTKLAA